MARKKKIEDKQIKNEDVKVEEVKAEKVVEVIVLHPIRFKEDKSKIIEVGTKLHLSTEKYEELKKKELIKKV